MILGLAKSSLGAHKVKAASIWTAHRFTGLQYRTCENFATRFRIGELSEVQTKSSALGFGCYAKLQIASGKIHSPKRLAASKVADALGFHPTLAKPSRMAMQRNSPVSATTIRTRPRQSVGAKNDPLYGWLIYEAECADRLIRLHYSRSSGLNG